MPLIFNTKTYTASSYGPGKTQYQGPAHTVTVKDMLSLSAVPAKPTQTFSGLARATAKYDRTATLTGALTPSAQASLTLDAAIPIGMAAADVDSMCNDFAAYVSSADFKNLLKKQQINY